MHSSDLSHWLRERPDGCTLAIRVQPGAKKTRLTGLYGEGPQTQLKIALKAPAIEGKANEALIAFCAEVFSLPRSSISIVAGELSRSKVCFLQSALGVTIQETVSSLFKDL